MNIFTIWDQPPSLLSKYFRRLFQRDRNIFPVFKMCWCGAGAFSEHKKTSFFGEKQHRHIHWEWGWVHGKALPLNTQEMLTRQVYAKGWRGIFSYKKDFFKMEIWFALGMHVLSLMYASCCFDKCQQLSPITIWFSYSSYFLVYNCAWNYSWRKQIVALTF